MMPKLGLIGLHKKKSVLSGEIDKKTIQNNNIQLYTIIDEIQSLNKLLIKYLNKDKIKQMIDYIIKLPRHSIITKDINFTWICSQIFNIGDLFIMKYFLKTNKELEKEVKLKKINNPNSNIFLPLNFLFLIIIYLIRKYRKKF